MFYIILFLEFFISLFWYVFSKIRNIILVNNLNCKEFFKEKRKNIKNQKSAKDLLKISTIIIIIFATYCIVGIIALLVALLIFFITLGGIAYSEAGGDPSFYNNLWQFVGGYFSLFVFLFFLFLFL